MKKIIVALVLFQITFIQYGQIVADHTVVDKYDEIPQEYIDEIKKMLVDIAGESHSAAYRIGQNLLEILDSRYQVLTYDRTIPAYSTDYLRIGRHASVGEATFYTSQAAIDAYKSHITNQNITGNPYSVIGFGWCWDMTWQNAPGGGVDPVYKVRWAGSSEGGPNGNLRWGLDKGDETLTGNQVCMDTYLHAVNQYNQYCYTNGYKTKVVYTTGPVDENAGTENGFQREIKHDYIRNYISGDNSRILFDYADILCWNNNGEKHMTNWKDGVTIRPHANIHPDNLMDYDASWKIIPPAEDGDHIGEVGALRLAKAMWWMLARIAGWDGETTLAIESKRFDKEPIRKIITRDKIEFQLHENHRMLNAYLLNYQGTEISYKPVDSNIISFDISSLCSGIYFVTLFNGTDRQVKKFMKP